MTKVRILILVFMLAGLSADATSKLDDLLDDSYWDEENGIATSFLSNAEEPESRQEDETDTSDSSHPTCTTEGCRKLSDTITRNMNLTADPCEDFYEYSCGGMLAQPPNSHRPHSTFGGIASKIAVELKDIIEGLGIKQRGKKGIDEVDTKVYDWYAACMNHNERERVGGEPLKKLIDPLGTWPAVNHEWDEKGWEIERAVAALHRYGSIDALFSSGLSNNARNVNTPLQPGLFFAKLGLGHAGFYINLKKPYVREVLAAYHLLLYELATLLGAEHSFRLAEDILHVIGVEMHLAQAMVIAEKTSYGTSLPYTTLGQLNIDSQGVFDWKLYIKLLYEGVNVLPFRDEDMVYLQHPKYVGAVLGIIDYYPKRILANYLMSQIAMQYGGALSSDFRSAYLRFYRKVYGLKKFSPEWSLCIRSTNKHLGEAIGYHFVKRNFKDSTLQQAENLVHSLTKTYLAHMDKIKWMDKETRAQAEKKIRNMLETVGYSKKIMDRSYLRKITKYMKVDPMTYFHNVLRDYQESTRYQLTRLGHVPKRGGFDMLMTAQNAQYEPTHNKIVVAAGLLQPPLFHKDYPSAINFGGIGMAVGHEITHGFDTSGARFDDQGNARKWWTNKTLHEFVKRANCFIKEYSKFSIYGYHLRGKQTINENIADNGGLRIAYEAYNNWLKKHGNDQALPGEIRHLKSRQLFFVAFSQLWCTGKRTKSTILNRIATDVHTLPKFRVIGTVRNMKEFADAFQCPVGSRMNPKKKCVVW